MKVLLPEPVSTSIWRYGYFEEDVCHVMLQLLSEGMTFIDVGAHFGFFTLLGSYLVGQHGKVISFEPSPETFQQLRNNVAGHSNVNLYDVAAFSEDGEISFHEYGSTYSAFNSVFEMRSWGPSRRPEKDVTVRCRTVDGIIAENGYQTIHLVKIDAESAEANVLDGMTETLKTHKPSLIIEVGDFEVADAPRSEELVDWLENRGYVPYEVRDFTFVPHIRKRDYRYGNLLFLPNK